jgi:hypothetical protein
MAQPSLESTLALTTGALKNIGFVEFTTDLVRNVYNVIVQSSLDQLKGFAELVKDVSQPVSDYQQKLGLGATDDPSPTPPTTDSLSLLANCEKYATEVLGLTGVTASGTIAPIISYKIDAIDTASIIDKRNAIISNLNGIDLTPGVSGGTIEEPDTMPAAPLITDSITSLPITAAQKENLDKIIAKKIRNEASDNYNLLLSILKLGMQKIVVDKGLIATKLTFHVDAKQTASKASSDVNIKSKSFALGGGVSGGFARIGGSISGGYSSSKLSVSVVNEKSSAVANMNADIVGEVRIEFRTDSFPSINN